MDSVVQITNEYKRQFIDDIINGMEHSLDNSQLMELNKCLNYRTSNLIISENPNNVDVDYEKTNSLLINQFIKHKKLKGLTNKSLNYYNSQLKHIEKWAIKSFIEFTADDLKEYLHFYQERNNCSNTSLGNVRRILSSFWTWLEIEEKIIINPMKRIPHIKVPRKVRKAFSDGEVELIRKAAIRSNDPVRNTAMVELLLSSGLRLSEITGLEIEDINFKDCKGVCMGKGKKERVFYFSEKCKLALTDYINSRIDDNVWLFVTSNAPYNKLGSSGFGTVIRQLGQDAGVVNVHPHRFRRTLATRLVRKGMPLEQVSKILGHESLSVTMRYVETDKELLRLTHSKHTN